jgi:outer membrane protein OmpA-like peptidoglycan-associated protein
MDDVAMKFLRPLLVASTLCSSTLIWETPAFAQDEMSAEEIQQKLKPKKLTRSLKGGDNGKAELDEILSRSIGIVERKKIVEITQKAKLPSLDFSINFDFDSADIDQGSYGTLDTLAEALKSQDLYEYRFLVNGHTDSKGGDDYNLDLSERRAASVVEYLVSRHDIDASRLKPIGFGETALKDEADGEAAENRRVEIINRP